jgi:hypothetical protein
MSLFARIATRLIHHTKLGQKYKEFDKLLT